MPVPPRRLTPAALTFLILTLAACGMASLLALLPAAGHDQMWLLYAARLTLHGAPLYGPQVFETNPPLILWLSTVPAALSSLTHIPDTALGKLFTIALIAAIGAVCLNLLRKLRANSNAAGLTPAVLYALAFAYITIFAVMPARDLGQRDDFLILFILPYVFAAAVRAESISIPPLQATLIGIIALAGVALKPHQLLIPIAIELTLLIRRRASIRTLFRPEILVMFLSGLAFLAAIKLFAPLYFTTILPLVGDTYWAYHMLTFAQLLGQSIQLHILLLIDLALFFTIRPRQTLPTILLIAGLAATLAFYLQGTGWYYQQLPALSLLSLALVFLLLDLAERRQLTLPSSSPTAAAALALLALALTTHFMDYPFTAARSFPVDSPDPSFFTNLAPGTPVMTIAPNIDATIQPIFKYHLTLAQRYPTFLMLPAILRSEDPQSGPLTKHLSPTRIAELDYIQRTDMIEDLHRWQPLLILVQRCQDPAVHCQVLEDRHDDLLAWFLRDPIFVKLWKNYAFSASRGEFDAYTLTTPSPGAASTH